MIVVVGAGVAGSMVARELALRGETVRLLERERFPRDKVCGGCLGPLAMRALTDSGLGSLPELCGGTPVRHFEWSARNRSVRMPLSGGYVVTRAAFDAALVEAACEAGVEFRDGVAATPETIDAPLVIVATGLGGGAVQRGSMLGAGVVLRGDGYEPGTIHMAHGPGGYVGTALAEQGRLVVGAALSAAAAREHGIAGGVARILAQAGRPPLPADAPWKGTPLLTRTMRPAYDGRVLYLGDAAGYVEPFTGEGIGWALHAARMLAPLAAEGWQPELGPRWQAILDKRVRPAQRRCRMLTRVLRWPVSAPLAIGVLRRFPGMAPRVVRTTTAWASTS